MPTRAEADPLAEPQLEPHDEPNAGLQGDAVAAMSDFFDGDTSASSYAVPSTPGQVAAGVIAVSALIVMVIPVGFFVVQAAIYLSVGTLGVLVRFAPD